MPPRIESADPEGLIPTSIDPEKASIHQDQKPASSPPDPVIKLLPSENPQNWAPLKKWSATLIIVLMTSCITFGSSIHASAVPGVSADFSCSKTVATLGITTYLLGFATGPLIFAPLSEVWGRSLVFRVVLGLFCCFNLGCSVVRRVEGLLVLRFLGGFFGSPTVTNSGGSLADIWPQDQRSVPFALFTTGSSLGPVIAPVVGDFVTEHLSWRWLYYLVTIISTTVYVAMLFLLPETYATVLLARKKAAAGIAPPRLSFKEQYQTNLTRPWIMLFKEPILFTLGFYSAFVWGILYLDFTAYPVVFGTTRGWSPGMSGLAFLGIAVGMAIATASSPYINVIHAKYVKKLGGSKPEARLPHLIYTAWLIPIALFWFAWSANPPTHWSSSIISGVSFGIGFVTLFLGTNAYLTDCYGRFSASALAANAVMRSLFSAGFPLFARQFYVKMGTRWAGSTLGFIAVAMALVPWLLYTYGPWLRARSKFHLWTVELEREEAEGMEIEGRGREGV